MVGVVVVGGIRIVVEVGIEVGIEIKTRAPAATVGIGTAKRNAGRIAARDRNRVAANRPNG